MQQVNSIRRSRKGSTLVETTLASSLTVAVLVASVGTFLLAMISWARGQGKIDAESGSQKAVKVISKELREAMAVTVDGNGQGLTYRLPSYDANGNYTVPITWDGVTRRLEVQGSQLVMVAAGNTRTVCKNLILTDPLSSGGTSAYRPFTGGAGAITRSLTIMVVLRTQSDGGRYVTSRSRETVYLRNIPDLFK